MIQDPGITYTNSSTSGFRNVNTTVKYPFVDWTHQILIANGLGIRQQQGIQNLLH
jgi:hypothetical protein